MQHGMRHGQVVEVVWVVRMVWVVNGWGGQVVRVIRETRLVELVGVVGELSTPRSVVPLPM